MSIYISLLILILLGLAIAFFGKRIMETMAFIIGAILGVAIALWLAPNLYEQFFSDYTSAEVCLIIGVIIGALIGGFLGRSLMYGMISFFVASIFSATAYYLSGGNYMVSLITFFIVLIIMWFLVEKFLAVMTALLGGCMVGAGVMLLTVDSLGVIALGLFIVIAAVLTIFGARYQLQND